MTSAVIYTKDFCGFCVKAKELLKLKNITYQEFILDVNGKDDRILKNNQSWSTKDELLKKRPDVKTLPQIWLDDEYVGGFTDLQNKLAI